MRWTWDQANKIRKESPLKLMIIKIMAGIHCNSCHITIQRVLINDMKLRPFITSENSHFKMVQKRDQNHKMS